MIWHDTEFFVAWKLLLLMKLGQCLCAKQAPRPAFFYSSKPLVENSRALYKNFQKLAKTMTVHWEVRFFIRISRVKIDWKLFAGIFAILNFSQQKKANILTLTILETPYDILWSPTNNKQIAQDSGTVLLAMKSYPMVAIFRAQIFRILYFKNIPSQSCGRFKTTTQFGSAVKKRSEKVEICKSETLISLFQFQVYCLLKVFKFFFASMVAQVRLRNISSIEPGLCLK